MTSSDAIARNVHMIGAGGAGMSGLAKLLSQMGHTVTGSDVKPGRMLDALADVGVDTWVGHRPEAVVNAQLVVASSAVPKGDEEIIAAREAGIPVWERPQLLAALTEQMSTIGFAGTHGKTTSTALAVAAFRGIDLDPSFLVGGEMIGLNTGAHLGVDDRFILEADEAFGTFRHLHLDGALVTNIEPDHLDYYGTVAALEDAFAQVAGRVTGPLVGCLDDAGVRRLAQRVSLVSYGFSRDAVWKITDHRHTDSGQEFTIVGPSPDLNVALPKPGAHLAANATGVLALMGELGLDAVRASEALGQFVGVRRRYEVRGRVAGVTIVDDYAHHPTEVAATISAATLGTSGRVIAVFQPHRYTRTADLGPQFGEPLALADCVVVTDVYAAGEVPMIGVSGRLVADAAEAAGAATSFVPNLSDIGAAVAQLAESGDTVVLLGAGDITSAAQSIALAIQAKT